MSMKWQLERGMTPKSLESPLKLLSIAQNSKELLLKKIKKIANMRLLKMFPMRISRPSHLMTKKSTNLENLAKRERKLSNMQEEESLSPNIMQAKQLLKTVRKNLAPRQKAIHQEDSFLKTNALNHLQIRMNRVRKK